MSAIAPASSILPANLDGPRAAWLHRAMTSACLLLISPGAITGFTGLIPYR